MVQGLGGRLHVVNGSPHAVNGSPNSVLGDHAVGEELKTWGESAEEAELGRPVDDGVGE
jgi:hypothetical protein